MLTPRYLASAWCTREVKEFCEAAEKTGGLLRDNKSRVFKVLKTPVDDQDALPAELRNILGYEFYTYENGAPLELDPAYGDRFSQDYNRTVARLAWEAREMLKQLEVMVAPASAQASASPVRETVYLAECSFDRRAVRDCLESELKMHGYVVLLIASCRRTRPPISRTWKPCSRAPRSPSM